MANLKLTCAVLAVLTLLVLQELAQAQGVDDTRTNRARRNSGRARGGNRGNSARGGNRGNRRRNRRPPAGCEEIHLPMCKGLLPYSHTKLPNAFNHTTQLQVYRSLEHKWAYMDHSCSKNLRLMLCAQYLPRCTRRGPGLGPCKRTCMRAKSKCSQVLKQLMNVEWGATFSCRGLPVRKCVKPMRESRCPYAYPHCVSNAPLDVCSGLSHNHGIMPNMFQQCHQNELNIELNNYQSLLATGCHRHLAFLLCGTYTPFCQRGDDGGIPFTFPCREVCEAVQASCEADYIRLNHGLPWPAKLQCHRLPRPDDPMFRCVMPGDTPTNSTTPSTIQVK